MCPNPMPKGRAMLSCSGSEHRVLSTVLWSGFGLALCLTLAAGALAADASSPSPASPESKTEQVTVSAERIDRGVLDRVIIPKFVESHGKAGVRINQVPLWHTPVCPETLGLTPQYDEGISHHVVEVARSVGAPTPRSSKCVTNVEILFTSTPQDELDWVEKHRPGLLGPYRGSRKKAATVTHAIQAWYVTGTRSLGTQSASMIPGSNDAGATDATGASTGAVVTGSNSNGGAVTLDTNLSPTIGASGNQLGGWLHSEIVNVIIVVDANKVGPYSLHTLANYIAMLALTHAALDDCSELPSILDLLSSSCGSHTPPSVITAADTAFLKALYAVNPEAKGKMHDHMLKEIAGP
jgi:hypothetical protein